MGEIAGLTMRQVSLIYYRERDKRGVPKVIKSGRRKSKSKDREKKEFFELGRLFGYKEDELNAKWELQNGDESRRK